MQPSVSVVIPVHNRGEKIKATLDSALAQDLPPSEIEIVVVDDGSTDDTFAVLQRLYGEDARVRLSSIANGGVAKARNFGLSKSRGEFIAFLDHDDLWLPAKLARQMEAMNQSERIGVVYCSWTSVDEAGAEMPAIIQFQRQSWWKAPRDGNAFPWILLPSPLGFVRNPIISMTIPLIRTEALREIGGFDEKTVPSDDWDLWIRLAHSWKFACVPLELAHYVHHGGQQHKAIRAAYTSAIAIYRKHRVEWKQFPWVRLKQETYRRFCRAMIYFGDAQSALERGEKREVWLDTLRAMRQQPLIVFFRRWHRLWWKAIKTRS